MVTSRRSRHVGTGRPRGRPTDDDGGAYFDPFDFVVSGIAEMPGSHEQRKWSKFYELERLLQLWFPTLKIVRQDESGRALRRENYDLPTAGVDELVAIVTAHRAQGVMFLANGLFRRPGEPWTDELREAAVRRTRVLISAGVKSGRVVRRFRDGEAAYCVPGDDFSDALPKTRAESRAAEFARMTPRDPA